MRTAMGRTGFMGAAWLVSLAACATALVAFAKELVVAGRFGASSAVDAYLASFVLVMFLPNLLAPVLQASFTPVFVADALQDPRQGWKTFSVTLDVLVGVLLLGGALILALAPWLLVAAAPGFTAETRALSLSLLYISLPIVVLYGLSEYLKQVLFALKTFFLPSLSQVLPSLCAIIGITLGKDSLGIKALAYGWVGGLAIQAGVLALLCFARGARYSFSRKTGQGRLRKIVWLGLPYFPVQFTLTALILIDRYFASQLGVGAISWLNYADKLFRIPMQIVSTAAYTVAFPFLAEMASLGKREEVKTAVIRLLGVLAFGLIPISVAIMVLGEQIVYAVYQRATFTAHDTSMTAFVLMFLIVGLFPQAAGYVLDRALCSLGDTVSLMKVAGWSLAVKVVTAYVLGKTMGPAGLALSTSLMLVTWAGLSFLALERRLEEVGRREVVFAIGRSVGCGGLMGGAILLALSWVRTSQPLLMLTLGLVVGGTSYLLLGLWMRSPELKTCHELFRRPRPELP